MSLAHDIRPFEQISDLAFLMSTWLKSYHVPCVPQPIYNIGQRNQMLSILADSETRVLVACDKESPELIFGYIVLGAGNTVHYLYTKGMYRGQGIGRSLLSNLEVGPIFYTARPPAEWICKRLRELPQYIYNPYLLQKK